jgi:uncharacterized protein (DUF433 family)
MATTVKSVQIVKTPGVRAGKARIDGTRVCVVDVVSLHKRGAGSEQILESFPHLTLAQVRAALDYYADHRQEIETGFAADAQAMAEDERRWEAMLARHGGRPPENPTLEERAIPRPFPWSAKT